MVTLSLESRSGRVFSFSKKALGPNNISFICFDDVLMKENKRRFDVLEGRRFSSAQSV